MISELKRVVSCKNAERVVNGCKRARSYVKSELGTVKETKVYISAKQKLKLIGQYLLNKAKNVRKSLSEFAHNNFTEAGRSKKAGLEPLEGKELEKFIRDTEMYDPNSPNYIHADYCRPPKKSK